MKPYGNKLAECPDVADCREQGRASRVGRPDGKCYARPTTKAAARRLQARAARRAARAECEATNDYDAVADAYDAAADAMDAAYAADDDERYAHARETFEIAQAAYVAAYKVARAEWSAERV